MTIGIYGNDGPRNLHLKFGQNLRYFYYGQMSPEQKLPGQMSLLQLESVQNGPSKLCLKFG